MAKYGQAPYNTVFYTSTPEPTGIYHVIQSGAPYRAKTYGSQAPRVEPSFSSQASRLERSFKALQARIEVS